MTTARIQQSVSVEPDESPAEESQWDFSEGERIVPGLTAIKKLGGGFRYEAYLAWDEGRRAIVVVKVVRPGLVDDERTLAGLADEAALLERLSHPVLLRSFGATLDGLRPHVVLEHLEGPRLSSLLRKYGPLPPEQLVPLALQLSSAIHYMSHEGFVHLDVKPSNIIMAGPPRLIDLSIARPIAETPQINSAVGTDGYMAPEQCRPDGSQIGPAADVWGIGATLYRAVSGQRPFPRESDEDRNSADPLRRWPQLSGTGVDLPASVDPRIAKPILACLEQDPSSRPSPAELADQLELVLEGLPRPRIARLKPRLGRR